MADNTELAGLLLQSLTAGGHWELVVCVSRAGEGQSAPDPWRMGL